MFHLGNLKDQPGSSKGLSLLICDSLIQFAKGIIGALFLTIGIIKYYISNMKTFRQSSIQNHLAQFKFP